MIRDVRARARFLAAPFPRSTPTNPLTLRATMSDVEEAREEVQAFTKHVGTLREEIGRVIVGNREVVDGVITCVLAGSHALLEGVPGLGKTMLVRTLAESL